ncbi:MAG: hypothetical protein WBE42_24785 [Pseudolabrys sp.]|jgi:hypothetical protein
MSQLRELTGRELDAVGGGYRFNFSNFLNNNGTQNFNNTLSVVGSQIGQQNNILSLVQNGVNNFA